MTSAASSLWSSSWRARSGADDVICHSPVGAALRGTGAVGRGAAARDRGALPDAAWAAHLFRDVPQHRDAARLDAEPCQGDRCAGLASGPIVGPDHHRDRDNATTDAGARPVHAPRCDPDLYSAGAVHRRAYTRRLVLEHAW